MHLICSLIDVLIAALILKGAAGSDSVWWQCLGVIFSYSDYGDWSGMLKESQDYSFS